MFRLGSLKPPRCYGDHAWCADSHPWGSCRGDSCYLTQGEPASWPEGSLEPTERPVSGVTLLVTAAKPCAGRAFAVSGLMATQPLQAAACGTRPEVASIACRTCHISHCGKRFYTLKAYRNRGPDPSFVPCRCPPSSATGTPVAA